MYPNGGKLYLKVGYSRILYKLVLMQQFMADCTTKKSSA